MTKKIYTKTGDKGETSLLGGNRIPKSSPQIESYGNIDELNAFLGLLKDQTEVEPRIKHQLYWIQEHLFNIGAVLACAPGFKGFKLPDITSSDIRQLEVWIDKYSAALPELRNFILPGGHQVVSLCHVCRTICRRTERSISALSGEEWNEFILPFINRLSDYFFILGRKLAADLKVTETPWNPTHD